VSCALGHSLHLRGGTSCAVRLLVCLKVAGIPARDEGNRSVKCFRTLIQSWTKEKVQKNAFAKYQKISISLMFVDT
jgi:hypothetical protein